MQNSPIYDGLSPTDAETLARTIRAAMAERNLRKREVDQFDKTPDAQAPVELVRRHKSRTALENLDAQISHWEQECGFAFT